MSIFHTVHLLFFHFETHCVVFSPHLDWGFVCFKSFGCRLILMIIFSVWYISYSTIVFNLF